MPDDNHESTVHEKKRNKFGSDTTRRNVIKVAGVGMVSLSSLPALGSAKKPSSAEVIQRGLRIREQTQSNERFIEYLRHQGFAATSEHRTYTATKAEWLE